jgi:hypothetical protein
MLTTLEHAIDVCLKKQNSNINLRHTGTKTAETEQQQLMESRAGKVSAELTRRGKSILLKKQRLETAFWFNVYNGQKRNDGISQVLQHPMFCKNLHGHYSMHSTSVPSQAE